MWCVLFGKLVWKEIWDLFGIKFSEHPDCGDYWPIMISKVIPYEKIFLTGFTQVKYDEELNKVVKEPVKLDQAYRNFDNMSPWDGMGSYLPGDEKVKNE